MDEILAKLLIEGGTLAIFVAFVIYLNKQQADERKVYLDALKEQLATKHEGEQSNMALGLASLDKVNGNIHELVAVNVELSKVMAVHDATSREGREAISNNVVLVLGKLDRIAERLKEGA